MQFSMPTYNIQLRWKEYRYGFYTVAGVNRKHAESRARRRLGLKTSTGFGLPGTLEVITEAWRRVADEDNHTFRGRKGVERLQGYGKLAEGSFRIVGEITRKQIANAWKQTKRACTLRDRKTVAAR